MHPETHLIGCIMLGMFFEIRGGGRPWEDAIADYNRKVDKGHYRTRLESATEKARS